MPLPSPMLFQPISIPTIQSIFSYNMFQGTLHNPMKNKRCEACDTTRGARDATRPSRCRGGFQGGGVWWV